MTERDLEGAAREDGGVTSEKELRHAEKQWDAQMAQVGPPPKKVAHDWIHPHNIMGGGEISKCPAECPAHERWKAERDRP